MREREIFEIIKKQNEEQKRLNEKNIIIFRIKNEERKREWENMQKKHKKNEENTENIISFIKFISIVFFILYIYLCFKK